MEKIFGHVALLPQVPDFLLSRLYLFLYRLSERISFRRVAEGGAPRQAELAPLAVVHTRAEFEAVLATQAYREQAGVDASLLAGKPSRKRFSVRAYCSVCNGESPMLVDYLFAERRPGQALVPNWRERLECPFCGMNNRQRLIAGLVRKVLEKADGARRDVYFMEQVTPIFRWASRAFAGHSVVGSEYLDGELQGGAIRQGIRHEDAMNLSFANASFDLVVSNDVFEHVPDPFQAFAECARVLKPGGALLMTVPFHSGMDASAPRAVMDKGGIRFLLPPEYHGNPVSSSGSLVFTDFGWDMLEKIREAGFSDVSAELYASRYHGHCGGAQLVFRAVK